MADDDDDLSPSLVEVSAVLARVAELSAAGMEILQTTSDASWVARDREGDIVGAVEATGDNLADWLALMRQYDLLECAAGAGYQVVRYGVDLERPHVCASLELIDAEGRTVARCDVGEEGATEALEAMLGAYMQTAVADAQEPGEA